MKRSLKQHSYHYPMWALCLIVYLSLQEGPVVSQAKSKRTELISDILSDYPRYMRPVHNETTKTTIIHGMSLIHIVDMDERNQIMTLTVWFRYYWSDEYLVWEPAVYDGLKEIRIPFALIWQPDIVLYNSGSDEFKKQFHTDAIVSHEGLITAFMPVMLKVVCKIDASYFPFDTQFCSLKFGSWSYHGDLIDITNETAAGEISQFNTNGEWDLIGMEVKRNVEYYPCCPEPYPDITYTIHLKRRSLFYIVSIVLPCAFISMLTLLSFYLPPDSGEKVTLNVTCMLSLMVFLILVNDQMPPTSEYIPYIQIYFITTIGLVTLSCVMTSFVLNIHFQGPASRPVPTWLTSFAFKGLAPIVGLSAEVEVRPEIESRRFKSHVQGKARTYESYEDPEFGMSAGVYSILHKISRQNNQLFKQVEYVTEGMKMEEKYTGILNEWKLVAKVVDRSLLIIFFSFLVLVTLGIFLVLIYG